MSSVQEMYIRRDSDQLCDLRNTVILQGKDTKNKNQENIVYALHLFTKNILASNIFVLIFIIRSNKSIKLSVINFINV